MYSFLLTMLGFFGAATRQYQRAKAMAVALGDPVAETYAMQTRAVALGQKHGPNEWLPLAETLMVRHGHWIPAGDYAFIAFGRAATCCVLGDMNTAIAALQLGVRKLAAARTADDIRQLIAFSLEVTSEACGAQPEKDDWFELLGVSRNTPMRSLTATQMIFLVRSRGLLSHVPSGTELEDVQHDFRKQGFSPKAIHPLLTEYYVNIAHCELELALRADQDTRPSRLKALRKALSELRKTANLDFIQAHAHAVQAYERWFSGRPSQASKHFEHAEKFAAECGAIWVHFSVARGRAHLLRDQGKVAAARGQAQRARDFAKQMSSAWRQRAVEREFELDDE